MPRPVRNCISLLQVQKNRPLILMEKADFREIMVWRESKNHFDFKIRDQFFSYSSCITGEGNGTPLQYSCLENLMDGGAW